jgi:hypothetical protein
LASAGGGLGVVGTEASVAPVDGASWTPAAFEEPPHPATAAADSTRSDMTKNLIRIERPRLAARRQVRVIED